MLRSLTVQIAHLALTQASSWPAVLGEAHTLFGAPGVVREPAMHAVPTSAPIDVAPPTTQMPLTEQDVPAA